MSNFGIAARKPIAAPVGVWLLLALAVVMLYAVTFDNGLISSRVASSAMYLHELFHDGRHLLGVPCH